MDGAFILFFIILAILGSIAGVLWWVFVAWIGIKSLPRIQREFEGMMTNAQLQMQRYAQLPPAERTQQQMQIAAVVANANRQFRELDALRQAKYDLRMSELYSMAADVGIDPSQIG